MKAKIFFAALLSAVLASPWLVAAQTAEAPATPPTTPPAALPESPRSAPLPAGEHWRLIFPGRAVAIEGSWAERGSPPEDLQAVWYWSETAAPVRLLPAELSRFAPRPAAQHFTHRRAVEGRAAAAPQSPPPSPPSGPSRPPATLIAGPLELWKELPEELMPHWPWPADAAELRLPRVAGSRWQARLLDGERGTFWLAPARGAVSASLPFQPAAQRQVAAAGPDGAPVADLQVDVLRPGGEAGEQALITFFREPEKGRIVIPSLPDGEPLVAVIKAPGFVPLTWQGRPAALPERFRLTRGETLSGRVVDAEGEPLAGIEVLTESWLPGDFPSYLVRGADSAADGTFVLAAVPPGSTRLVVRGGGRAPLVRDLEVPPGGLRLGDLSLGAGRRLTIEVRGENGEPLAGARIQVAGAASPRLAGASGEALLEGVDPETPLELEVSAAGYLAREAKLYPPFPPATEVRLAAAFTVVGTFLDEEGAPVIEGRMMAKDGSKILSQELEGAGAFELALPAGRAFELRLLAAAGGEARLALAPGEPGERRQLGELRAAAGRRVVGRLVAATGGPVAGGRAWLPRPGELHESIAAFFGDLLATSSDADGAFELRGLPPGSVVLRIDAAGFARRTVPLPAGQTSELADLGDIVLDAGAELEVAAPEVRDGAAVHLDLGGRGLEIDQLATSVYDGLAYFAQAPPGAAVLSVMDGAKLLCEKKIQVPETGLLEVDCRRGAVRVSGRVTRGGQPSGQGRLVFLAPAAESPQFIRHQATPGGLRKDDLIGLGRPPVEVSVGPDGYFATEDLLPGRWLAAWTTDNSYGSELEVEIADAAEAVLQLDFPALRVAGRVVDPEGRPVPEARVRDTTRGRIAACDVDGAFVLEGMPTGESWLVAVKDGERSPAVRAVVDEKGAAEEVRLVIGAPRDEGKVEVRVLLQEGDPAAAALVFLETSEGSRQLLSAAGDGVARFELERPFPSQIRAGAYADGRLALGEFRPFEVESEPIELQVAETGSLRLEATQPCRPFLQDGQGWDVSWWLSRLGLLPQLEEGREEAIEGLPVGSYRGTLGPVPFQVEVEAGQVARVDAR